MREQTIGQLLRCYRKSRHLNKEQTSALLLERYGMKAAANSILNWEEDVSYPHLEKFIALCELYGITNITEFFHDPLPETIPGGLTAEEIALIEGYRKSGKSKYGIQELAKIPPHLRSR